MRAMVVCSVACLFLAKIAYSQVDTHRLPCESKECKSIRVFVKAHYCGESPFGNGPDDGCRIPNEFHRASDVQVKAGFACDSSDSGQGLNCRQQGSIPSGLRTALVEQMQRLGLPKQSESEVLFSQMVSTSSGWSLLDASYQHLQADELRECDVLAAADANGHLYVLHRVTCQNIDFEKPLVTTWTSVDIASVNGREEFILTGDAYEDHWFEAFEILNGKPRLVFSGLGYYL